MISRLLMSAACSAILLTTGPVLAQQGAPAPIGSGVTGSIPSPSNLREVSDDDRMIPPWNVTLERIDEMEVISPAGEEMAEVEALLEDASGQIAALVLEVEGLDGDEREVIVPLNQMNFQEDRLTTNLTVDQLRAMPKWDD
jgi:hypothetical protein